MELPIRDPEELREVLTARGLERVRDRLMALALPAIAIELEECDEDSLPVGASKIGGRPDMPLDAAWPTTGDAPLQFLAQIALAHTAPHDAEGALPHEGLLQFFYDAEEQPWGFDPQDRGGWRVLCHGSAAGQLTRCAAPGPADSEPFTPCALAVEPVLTLPPFGNELDDLGLTGGEADLYLDLLPDMTPGTCLLGHPAQVQGDMRLECQLASSRIYVGDPEGYRSAEAEARRPGAADWRLLFQLDSEDAADMMWGDCGMLYFWIRKQDLAARALDKTWLVLQCY